MSRLVKFKFNLYRKFELDIWGYYTTFYENYTVLNKKFSKFFFTLEEEAKARRRFYQKRLVYTLISDKPPKKKKVLDERLVTWQLVRLFYIHLKYNQFKKYKIISRTKPISFFGHYAIFLETRIGFLAYRLNLLPNLFEMKSFAKRGLLAINGTISNFINANPKLYDFIHPSNYKSRLLLKLIFKNNYKKNLIWFNIPVYLFFDHIFFFCFLKKLPIEKDLNFPITLDLMRGADYDW